MLTFSLIFTLNKKVKKMKRFLKQDLKSDHNVGEPFNAYNGKISLI